MGKRKHYNYGMPDWTEYYSQYYSPWRPGAFEDVFMPSGMEALSRMTGDFLNMMQGMSQMAGDLMRPWMTAYTRTPGDRVRSYKGHHHRQHHHPHHHKHDSCCHPCETCGGHECHCTCCIGDADLVIYSRLGEARLVPVFIENSRRREREIKLELSDWTSRRGSKLDIQAQSFLQPTEFTLGACEEQEVILLVRAIPEQEAPLKEAVFRAAVFVDLEKERKIATREPIDVPDVDECTVLYADLRVEGCDIRPIRIALAILPRDCGAFEIECGCSCC